jgi:hypothetical protein
LAKSGDKTGSGEPPTPPERRASKRAPSGNIGSALRSVYDGALHEDIPPEMLDLLGKLD